MKFVQVGQDIRLATDGIGILREEIEVAKDVILSLLCELFSILSDYFSADESSSLVCGC